MINGAMTYKLSEFNFSMMCENGTLRMYNSLVGSESLVSVCKNKAKFIKDILAAEVPLESLSSDDRSFLISKGFLVPMKKDEEKALAIKANETIFGSKTLHLIILPTECCNFRCRYCYESFLKGKMSEEVQSNLIDYVRKNISNYSGLSVVWFGGEPLLAIDVIKHLSEKFIEICKKAKRTYIAGITTNGFDLTVDMYETLYKLRVLNYQVTLDGYKDQHDSQRILADGSGTFDKIVTNLAAIRKNCKTGTIFMIRTNYTKGIIDNIDDYLNFYRNTFEDDVHFSPYIQKAADWGGSRVGEFKNQFAGDGVYAVVLKKMREHGVKLGLSSHFSELNCELNTCYAAKEGHFVIGADGMVYKCTVALDFPENQVGYIEKGGKLDLNENYKKWINIYNGGKGDCVSCFNRGSCLPMKCAYHCFESENPACPPMGGANLGLFLERFRDELFTIME